MKLKTVNNKTNKDKNKIMNIVLTQTTNKLTTSKTIKVIVNFNNIKIIGKTLKT